MNKRLALPAVAVALAGLSACSDSPVAPTAAPVLTKPSFVINASPITPVAGQVWVCKVWLGTAGNNPSVTTTANPVRTTLTINAANIPSLGSTCVLVATSTASNQDANPTWDEDHIIVTETPGAGSHFVSGKVFFSGDAANPAPPPESFATTTRNQTFNFFHGAVIVFENEKDPPPPVCTFTKGWYRNNGEETVIAVDGRTKGEAQTIFDATPGQPGGVTWQNGNDLLNLYQQLLAALINLGGDANEDNGPAAVDAAIDAAQNGTGGTGLNITTTLTQQQISDLINTLSAFNQGEFAGFPHCDDE